VLKQNNYLYSATENTLVIFSKETLPVHIYTVWWSAADVVGIYSSIFMLRTVV